MSKKGDGSKGGDERRSFLKMRVKTAFKHGAKFDASKFEKAFEDDKNSKPMESFLDEPECRTLVFNEAISATTNLATASGAGKYVTFTKVRDETVTAANVRQLIVCSEVAGQPINQLQSLVDGVYLPMLSNPGNQTGLGDVLSKEIMDRFHTFMDAVDIARGHMKGDTSLPLPPATIMDDSVKQSPGTADSSTGSAGIMIPKVGLGQDTTEPLEQGDTRSKNRIALLESSIVTWTKQIRDVLRLDPETPLKEGQNPLPSVEVAFWRNKARHLNYLHEQLNSFELVRVLNALSAAKSHVFVTFTHLCAEVAAARKEANSNVLYLSTIEDRLKTLESQEDLLKLREEFIPLMHNFLLIWKHSPHYNTPSRLVVLVREMCNALIDLSCKYISSDEIFEKIESEQANEAVGKIKIIISVIQEFQSTFFDYKARAAEQCPDNPWRVQNSALFKRLEAFNDRCEELQEFLITIVHFEYLAKVEIGGTKGKTLTSSVNEIYSDFQKAVIRLRESATLKKKYAIMDVGATSFRTDYFEFRESIKQLESRLGSVLTQSLDDSPDNLTNCFKLLNSFDVLLSRRMIMAQMDKHCTRLIEMYTVDLQTAHEYFISSHANPPREAFLNLPDFISAIHWSRGLGERVKNPMEKLRQIDAHFSEREEAKSIVEEFFTLCNHLEEYETGKVKEWASGVEAVSQAKLKLPLLVRDAVSRLLSVNFDDGLVKMLREVKYFQLMQIGVPDAALQIYKKAEDFRQHRGNLDIVVDRYNAMRSELLPVEAPLLRREFEIIDSCLKRGIMQPGVKTTLNWKSGKAISTFVAECMETVNSCHQIYTKLKNNMKQIRETLDSWNTPLLKVGDTTVEIADFNRMQKTESTAMYKTTKEGSSRILQLLKDSNSVTKVSSNKDWVTYTDYVGHIVVEGLVANVCLSLGHLLEQISPTLADEDDTVPMIAVKLELYKGKEVKFKPTVAELRSNVQAWTGSCLQFGNIVKRTDGQEGGTYVREMHQDPNVLMFLSMINDRIAATETSCDELRAEHELFSDLWTKDIDEEFEAFTKDAVVRTARGAEMYDLEKYDSIITHFTTVQEKIASLSTPTNLVWLRVDSAPIKSALAELAVLWRDKFTRFLHDGIQSKLQTLHDFMMKIDEELDIEVANVRDEENLKAVMENIRAVRLSADVTTESFGPLGELLRLLGKHRVDLTDIEINGKSVADYLEDAPSRWDSVVGHMFRRKEEIMPLQQSRAEMINADKETFFLALRALRNEFRAKAPFAFDGSPDEAYHLLDHYAAEIESKAMEAKALNELGDLFELSTTNYPEIADTRSDLNLLKMLWDNKDMVLATHMSWRTALWSEIDTESLDDENKLLIKGVRAKGSSDPIVKGWQVYRDVEEIGKNMQTVLPLVNALHSDAMRDRHWEALAKVTGVDEIDPHDKDFCLDDMLKLELHKYVDDVEEIVETATKELKIEAKLKEMKITWSTLELDFLPHKDSDVMLIKPSEDVIEALEANQLDLQTIIGMGKFVDYFRDQVMYWQKSLGDVEEVLKDWVHVSKMWASLENIFLASADIRAQLPDDTKRFEGIDSEFKDVMKDAIGTPNVKDCTLVEGREETLKTLIKQLELCQKSLNEYLDVKKKIFPRFYFVSNVALLEILSNGNNPPRIMSYIGDCYDSLSYLTQPSDDPEFAGTEEEPKNLWRTIGLSMVAKDGERIALPEPFEMTGAVENWLNALTEAMRACLRTQLNEAVDRGQLWDDPSAEPRHKWLFLFPAQVVLTGSQHFWTEESELALEELEGGSEDSVKNYKGVCDERLQHLIALVLGKLSKPDRCKIISLITLDVHARDVVQKLVDEKAESTQAFLWQQQLRFYFQPDNMDVNIKICDYRCKYFYEWIGNTGRLVITPLTDRCYITLTMALRLYLGGAPAGPAGTGKTETTKDLARCIALPCYVFNCSDQMNFESLGDIFRGLCQAGAWGCFDEFNRISIEVLSVVASQVKLCQDAIVLYSVPENREEEYQHIPAGTPPVKVGEFEFMGDIISLIPTCGMWITMNPGYAGRSELPENLKVLFRSCAMIRPDLKPICENMLMAEGFQNARSLAVKFVTLYTLSSQLLSKQYHYDWGLRAVKSVLRVAGGMKRGAPDLLEDKVLMRALRDFNTPKIPDFDTPIFMRLIADLFIGLDVPMVLNPTLAEKAHRVALEMKLQPDDAYLLKVVQFQELLDVRHSVFVLGPAGCGKTMIWKGLSKCNNLADDWKDHEVFSPQTFRKKDVSVWEQVNPKSVITDELYGYMTLSKDWKDGCLAIIMRGMSKNLEEQGFKESQTHKWVILDGDIDALWIESMNTVMDDNKVLTLVSNERVPLTAAMRMIFEINSLKNASPATVSRAGILFINEADIGWKPFVDSWADRRDDIKERESIPALFDKYVPHIIEFSRKFKQSTPIRLMSQVITVCHILEALLNGDPDCIEPFFVFAVTWAFGGPLAVDKQNDFRKEFHNQFTGTFADIARQYPSDGLVFDHFFDPEQKSFVPWSSRVSGFTPPSGGIGPGHGQEPFGNLFVSTMDTTRMSFLLDSLASNNHCAMLVGGAGTGKTTVIQTYLHGTDEDVLGKYISMNYFTDSKNLQQQLEANLEKRSGRTFGPKPGQKIIYFIDDMNLPYVEEYGTQNAMALLHQHMDHGTIFDRDDLGMRKEIVDVYYMAAMNPTSGSFFICERNQRRFSTFTCTMPDTADLKTIYGQILTSHLSKFTNKVQKCADDIVNATIALHTDITNKFLPSAIKFVYNWNMRELRNVFQGVCMAQATGYTTPTKLQRLWAHECNRVFCDRLMSESEFQIYAEMLATCAKQNFENETLAETTAEPNVFTKFAVQVEGQDMYIDVPSMDKLGQVLGDKLHEYNESNPIMDLVLFDQAMEHVCRICRIISSPAGNAMLIGVGGSGKQSLTKLAAFICDMEVKQLNVTANFKVDDLKEYLKELYKLSGIKGQQAVFIFTDSQIVNEQFLVYINSMLASGWIPDLFPKDEMEGIYSGVRNEAKANGIADSPEALLEFFVTRVRANLHIVLCFSPVGEIFRVRARRFPGLINCTTIDRFHPWSREALEKVAKKFLAEVDLGSKDRQGLMAQHMSTVHLSVTQASVDFRESMRRHNHVTPKSFLELISFFKALLAKKRDETQGAIDRLDVGLSTIRHTSEDVAELQVDLEHTMVKVAEKVEATDILIAEMAKQQEAAEIKQVAATKEEELATAAAAGAAEIEAKAEAELAQAKPAMEAAAAAVDVLSKAMLGELKGLNKPPSGVDRVTTACLIMVEHEFKNHKWDRAKKMMAQPDQFKQRLQEFDGRTIPDDIIKKVAPIIEDPEFTPEFFLSKSAAAANLATWLVNIYGFNRIYVKVKPLMDSLAEAQDAKAKALAKMEAAQAEVREVQEQLADLEATFKKATAEKQEVEEQAAACNERLGLANRLVGGLASENERWGKEIEILNVGLSLLVGDVMLASAFVSYIGAFDQKFRNRLWNETWLADLTEKQIATTSGVDPLNLITTDAQNAKMNSEGLPSDRISLESGAIVVACKRWPLIIDPQQQAIKWLRKREEKNNLDVVQLTQPRWLNRMGAAIQNGYTVIIENVTEDIDSTLDPVLSRAVYRKGRSYYLRLGGEEVDYDMKFRLYLQTKLSNPHFPPETLAQCTLVNFIATEQGLEEQLLALAVKLEQPELEEKRSAIVAAFQQYKIKLHELEDNLLDKLANAPDDILSDVSLVESLEATKEAVSEINAAVEQGHHTEVEINKAREVYRPVAYEGSMLYFMLTQLCAVVHMYQYSLDAYLLYFARALDRTEAHQDILKHVAALGASLRITIFTWVSRGLFEQHKLIFLTMLTFQLIQRGKLEDLEISTQYYDFLMRCPKKVGETKPESLSWLPDAAFYAAQALSDCDDFQSFASDLVEAAPRFREWYNHVTSETEKLPMDWAALEKEPVKKMLVVRCLRPDRMRIMLTQFVETVLPNGSAYTQCDGSLNSLDILKQSYADSSPTTPLYFILSPGADVVADVDKLAAQEGMEKGASYHNVSMGQGQDVVAMERLEQSHRNGHWVILNNLHLMPRWCVELEKTLDAYALDGPHQRARLFLTSDPSPAIPIGILSRCIKLTNEPPGGLKANLKRAWCSFNREMIDESDSKSRTILFALCNFHAVLMERKLYGPLGYNMQYPFSLGDLRDSSVCLNNYMEANAGGKIPWADLRYIFGEIMYGGHIVNDFDRLLANTYLEWYMKDELLDETEMFPYVDEKGVSFKSPQAPSFQQGLEHIEEALTQDTPLAFGLHPNAEIDFRTTQSDRLFATLVDLQPRDAAGDNDAQSPQAIAETVLNEVLDRFADKRFDTEDVQRSLEEQGPFQNAFLQEIERMNTLMVEIARSLHELQLGFAGELTMSEAMEALQNSLSTDRIPPKWMAWPSLRALAEWCHDVSARIVQLEGWVENPMEIPDVTWISGLINPQSFLTAICQVTAQKQQLELDKLLVQTELLRQMRDGVDGSSPDGAYIHGLFMQGARWDTPNAVLEKSKPKEMYCAMPVLNCRAILSERLNSANTYFCPCYMTNQRGPTYVFSAQLKTKVPPGQWILAGVALIMDIS